MMANLLNWFGGTKGELREALPAGAVTQVDISPAKDGSVARVLVAPDGREQPLLAAAGASKVTVGPLDQCGVWRVLERATAAGPQEVVKSPAWPKTEPAAATTPPDMPLAELACNLADRRESDLRPSEGLPDRIRAWARASRCGRSGTICSPRP